jgi:UDP-N-acetylmuramyl-tripeptide synthetase
VILADVIEGLKVVDVACYPDGTSIQDITVSSIEYDSRNVKEGSLFCCLAGEYTDGHDFASQATSSGAHALLVERQLSLPVSQVIVEEGNARAAMAVISANFYRHPSQSLVMVGATGTNGKTTVTHMIASILEAGGIPTRTIGTLGGARTTPESPDLQRILADAVASGAKAVSMEVSSHGIVQHRVDAIHFDVAVFTNLSPEHLDFHVTMNDYFEAKAALFTPDRVNTAVIYTGDEWGRLLAKRVSGMDVLTFDDSDVRDVSIEASGSSFILDDMRIRIPMVGMHNIRNAAAAARVASALGIPYNTILDGLASMLPLPGRSNVYEMPNRRFVVVDFAHTPEALEELLKSARRIVPVSGGRVVCVFGCGGNRDRLKRPRMGQVASSLADRVVLTSDNSRYEEPEEIIREIIGGVDAGDRARVEIYIDRREAIEHAIRSLGAGDVAVIAGKGHETTMESRGEVSHFDDAEVVRSCIDAIGAGGSAC